MIEFKVKLETIPDDNDVILLFQNLDLQKSGSEEKEYLLHLEADYPYADNVIKQQAQFILVVDRSGSMRGNPWSQVQSAILQMLDLASSNDYKCEVIQYNNKAGFVEFSSNKMVNAKVVNDIRATGSTNFKAAFNQLSSYIKKQKTDDSKSYFIIFMTDGMDTCNNSAEIMSAKEHLQVDIEKLGSEVIFHVLGFNSEHDEAFLESLTYLGTSDGTYNFVNEREGKKALEERLVELLTSTTSTIGKSVNIQIESDNVKFLGEWFGQGESDVVLPAMIIEKDGKMKIVTKKFVSMIKDQEPNLKVNVYEKLTEGAQAKESKVTSVDMVTLHLEEEVDSFNFKKLRNTLNMMTDKLGEEGKNEEELKGWYVIADEYRKKKGDKLSRGKKENAKIVKTVDTGLGLVKNVLYPTDPKQDERERGLRMKEMSNKYKMASKTSHNRQVVKKRATGNNWVSSPSTIKNRSDLQQKSRATDFTLDDFALEEED